MKVGRNDPCPCGSGKKYKKCCLSKDQAAGGRTADLVPPSSAPAQVLPHPTTPARPKPSGRRAAPRPSLPKPPPRPRDPRLEAFDARWTEFASQDYEGQIAVFFKTLDDTELMDKEMAFEMLSHLHTKAVKHGERQRFAELVGALRQRQPEVFREGAHFHLSRCLEDALAEGRLDAVPPLARELAARAGRDIDIVNRSLDALAYHGQLSVLVEAMRIGWPGVKTSANVIPWGISEFAEKGADYEILDYLEHTATPDPADSALLERVRFFVEEPDQEYLAEFISGLTGKAPRAWKVDDFALKPPRKRSRGDRDDAEEEDRPPHEGARNLSRLITEFVGYWRRVEGVSFSRGELVRDHLFRYFLRRQEGDLDPQPSMLERALHPKKTLPKPPRPIHPLCPERVTFDVHLATLVDMFNGLYHAAAALFESVPAWLRFLQVRGLIEAVTREKTVAELRPLHTSVLRLWERHTEDLTLYRAAQAWPADAARGPAEGGQDTAPHRSREG